MAVENTIWVVCACGKRLKAPASSAGKKGRCPACGNTVVLAAGEISGVKTPAAAAARPAMPPPVSFKTPDEEDDGMGAMFDLAKQAGAAPASGAVCPQCRAAMEGNAVLCTNCGYNIRTGKSLAAAPAKSGKQLDYMIPAKGGKKVDKQVDYMAPDGSLVMGVVLSAVFALAASIVWVVIAWLTGLTIGYIAILIGGAAGVGMQMGHRGYSRVGGIVAAAMTLLAILVAKVAVLEIILARKGSHVSIFNLDPEALGKYFFSPMGLIIIAVGVGAAFRTANGSLSN